jgi:Coenzyme PQQ synthesis protein D (PqqD)
LSRLCVGGPSVVHETIEGEVIIVNLDKGLYFSTDGVGACIWAMIVAGRTADEILLWAKDALDAGHEVAADVAEFLDDLRENELVRVIAETPEGGDFDLPAAPATYAKPTLHVYADMEELLLLDPIHDVSDDAGWPHAAPEHPRGEESRVEGSPLAEHLPT